MKVPKAMKDALQNKEELALVPSGSPPLANAPCVVLERNHTVIVWELTGFTNDAARYFLDNFLELNGYMLKPTANNDETIWIPQ